MTANTFLEQMRAALDGQCDTVPKGWLTAREIADLWKLKGAHTRHRLRDMNPPMRMFRVRTGQVVRPVPHYRLK